MIDESKDEDAGGSEKKLKKEEKGDLSEKADVFQLVFFSFLFALVTSKVTYTFLSVK